MHEQNYASSVSCTMALLLYCFPFRYSGMYNQFKHREVTFFHVVLYATIWHASFFNIFLFKISAENANSVVKPFAWSQFRN